MALRFEPPSVGNIRNFIKSPIFAGAYVYGRRHWRKVQAGEEPAPPNKLIGQFVERWDHHEGYISKEEFFENQRTLALNQNIPKQPVIGPGPALLQGRCVCARHGAMSVHYHATGRERGWSFTCLGDYLHGGEQCVAIPGRTLEPLVVEAVLEALDVPAIEEAERLWRSEHADWRRRFRRLEQELERKVELHDELRRRVSQPDPGTHPRVRAMLEDEFAKLDEEVERLRCRVLREEVDIDPFTEHRWQQLKALCADVRALWAAPTTEIQDRKQLIRLLVRRVVLEHIDAESVRIAIEWADDRHRTTIERPRVGYFHGLMWKWDGEGITAPEMVEKLRKVGARTQQDNAWSLATVRATLLIMRRNGGPSHHLPKRRRKNARS